MRTEDEPHRQAREELLHLLHLLRVLGRHNIRPVSHPFQEWDIRSEQLDKGGKRLDLKHAARVPHPFHLLRQHACRKERGGNSSNQPRPLGVQFLGASFPRFRGRQMQPPAAPAILWRFVRNGTGLIFLFDGRPAEHASPRLRGSLTTESVWRPPTGGLTGVRAVLVIAACQGQQKGRVGFKQHRAGVG